MLPGNQLHVIFYVLNIPISNKKKNHFTEMAIIFAKIPYITLSNDDAHVLSVGEVPDTTYAGYYYMLWVGPSICGGG